MDVTRVQEIIQSKSKIVVEFEGTPVWIDGLDENSKTARVHTEENPIDKKTVAINELREVH